MSGAHPLPSYSLSRLVGRITSVTDIFIVAPMLFAIMTFMDRALKLAQWIRAWQ